MWNRSRYDNRHVLHNPNQCVRERKFNKKNDGIKSPILIHTNKFRESFQYYE